MSEKQALYLVEKRIVLVNFIGLTIDGADFTSRADKVVLTRIEPLCEYTVIVYKDELPIWHLSQDQVLDTVFYENSIWLRGACYEILTKNALWKTTLVAAIEQEMICCPFCNRRIFPEPQQYCAHVAFVYVSDFEELWVYREKRMLGFFDESGFVEEAALSYIDFIERISEKHSLQLYRYIDMNDSEFGRPMLCIGFYSHE